MKAQIAQIMTSTLETVRAGDNLQEAYLKLAGFRHLPVIDDDGSIIGIISERDFQRAIVSQNHIHGKPKFKEGSLVQNYMSWPVVTVDAKTSFLKVVEIMVEKKISAVLVTHLDELIGIITSEDLLHALSDLLKQKRSFKEQIYEKLNDWAYHSPIGQILHLLSNVGI